MNNGRWKPEEEAFIRENAGKLTIEQMSEAVGRSPLAVHLFMHRRQIVVGQTVRRNLVQEMLRLKFRHPENFMPSRHFYRETGINQMRWWVIFRGEKNITQQEYVALSKYFGITLEEAFEARQLSFFEQHDR
ncbi:XRE family transcriptional regulator [Bacteroides pyogenes]|uniref:XRE family transcriptional regulator n=1 Tax=Bacteroides pyogenes TaxID=310300 RepID=UPI002A913DB7|nr:XRE family transcriptional regulator [Bacteroides pyogenes]MDY5433678.1 XRE family transcriptional regulator [Bacteroides pyogenes]